MPTEEFEDYKNDPKLNSALLPEGTLVFKDDEAAWLVIGPSFTNLRKAAILRTALFIHEKVN